MNAHATRCDCGECRVEDKRRWQGIPGASQLALIEGGSTLSTPSQPQPSRMDGGLGGLPLFDAPQPQLF